MSSYLQMAEVVLRSHRRPMSARAILNYAYGAGIAPYHLHGRTQHKTLQARLSEDILHRRDQSLFFRTKPGYFFLREFLTDASVPAEFRRPILARRRTRDLLKGQALSFSHKRLSQMLEEGSFAGPGLVDQLAREGVYRYVDPKHASDDDVLIWAVSALTRGSKMLSYRVGRYRDDRDNFAQKRSIAFTTLVSPEDHTLFDFGNLGVVESAYLAAATDLDVPLHEASVAQDSFETWLRFFAWQPEVPIAKSLVAYVEVAAPEWFEPSGFKLSLNDLSWIDLSVPPNNIDDFDPWSKTILSYYHSHLGVHV